MQVTALSHLSIGPMETIAYSIQLQLGAGPLSYFAVPPGIYQTQESGILGLHKLLVNFGAKPSPFHQPQTSPYRLYIIDQHRVKIKLVYPTNSITRYRVQSHHRVSFPQPCLVRYRTHTRCPGKKNSRAIILSALQKPSCYACVQCFCISTPQFHMIFSHPPT